MNVTWVSSFHRICRMSFRPSPSLPAHTPAGQKEFRHVPLLVQHSGHFFCSAAETNWGFFGFVSVPAWVLEFYDHKSFTSQMDDSNKSRHTHAHTHTDVRAGAHNLDVAWRGHFITRTHIAHTQRWPQASFASSGLVGCTN